MTERVGVDEYFVSKGIDTTDPDWQIKSLSDEGLHGFIVDANQRMGIISPERVDQAAVNLDLEEYTQKWVDKYTINNLLDFLHESIYLAVNPQGESDDEKRSSIEALEALSIDVSAYWRKAQKEKASKEDKTENHLEIGTSEAFISAATFFRWVDDPKRLVQLSDDVSNLKSAYQEMERRTPKNG